MCDTVDSCKLLYLLLYVLSLSCIVGFIHSFHLYLLQLNMWFRDSRDYWSHHVKCWRCNTSVSRHALDTSYNIILPSFRHFHYKLYYYFSSYISLHAMCCLTKAYAKVHRVYLFYMITTCSTSYSATHICHQIWILIQTNLEPCALTILFSF